MRERAAVVIIGGGVVGASVAYHLAQRGIADVVVVERSALGSGSTGRSAGGVRQQFSTEVNCRLSMLSVQKLLHFESDTGWDPRFRQVGYLFLLTREKDWQLFQRNVALQRSLGLEQATLVRGWAGLYDVTPDANPILGWVPEVKGFLMAAGFSGHGFMHSPATGQLVAEIIADGSAHTIDVAPFALSRFATPELIAEQNVI